MAAIAILDFLIREILFADGPEGWDASACQISSKSVNWLQRY